MRHSDWSDAGQGWQGKETSLRLHGWSRHRRIVLLRRKLARDIAISDRSAGRFVHWYNEQHRHSGIRYVTPAQRHAGQDGPVLAARRAIYQEARQRNPQRWSGSTRTGNRSGSSPSIRSAIPSSGWPPLNFPVRSASLLSRPDLAASNPRRATQGMGGAEPPGATRRAPWRTSMARLASIGPSPQ
jgi:hypothetical protein